MRRMMVTVAAVAAFSTTANAALVINEVYPGGGNSGAPFNQDFVELLNNGLESVSLGGLLLQYSGASATATFSTFATLPEFSLAPSASYLVAFGTKSTTNGVDVPNVNLSAGTSISAAVSGGSVRVVISGTLEVVDLVGYGSAPAGRYEGLAPAPTPTNTTSVQRVPNGVDTDQNGVDFKTLAPTPVPEPSAVALALIGSILLQVRRRRRRSVR